VLPPQSLPFHSFCRGAFSHPSCVTGFDRINAVLDFVAGVVAFIACFAQSDGRIRAQAHVASTPVEHVAVNPLFRICVLDLQIEAARLDAVGIEARFCDVLDELHSELFGLRLLLFGHVSSPLGLTCHPCCTRQITCQSVAQMGAKWCREGKASTEEVLILWELVSKRRTAAQAKTSFIRKNGVLKS